MRTTKQLSITIPLDMAEAISAKVSSGEYASESEVIRDGVRTLLARDEVVERWLRDEVVRTYDLLQKDRSLTLTVAEVRAALRQQRPVKRRKS
jgi:putative addiction module CopG family antidote